MKLNNVEVGRRYARALFDYAQENGKEQAVLEELQILQQVYEQVPSLGAILTDARLTLTEKQALLKKLQQKFSKIIQVFLQLLLDYRRLNALPEIVAAYLKLFDEKTATYAVTVTSAVTLDQDQLHELQAAVKQRFHAQTVVVQTQIDPEIIGGIIIRVGDQVIDGSIRTRIKQLNQALLNN
ncbi:F0F1 ATP synthase subunit delta [Lactobacillus sp. DCY120]|uniref:ATP synthase subunit delta n=1 Tax=Bombilactobacillus apium TaxID=2675299 RepID=A0A850QZX3_9LACO|nr:ATP synthase F1 subunit delta [Bombilactobacillus apium]NVY95640.1 F0F1 ATP synthase subunit delta [Bombilactobacillus apium]